MFALDGGPGAGAWWTRLAPPDAPKIIARLPFVERADHPAGLPVFVISRPLVDGAAREVVLESVTLDRWRADVPKRTAQNRRGGHRLRRQTGSGLPSWWRGRGTSRRTR